MTYLRPLPQQAYLRECFDYNPETGTLTWRHRPQHHFRSQFTQRKRNGRFAGKIAGIKRHTGYRVVNLNAANYLVSRLIWRLMTGEEPIEIDHINRVRDDNRWQNLRSVTRLENLCNSAQSNKTGLRGVYKTRSKHSFCAVIHIAGKAVHLGSFPSAETAHAVYREMRLYRAMGLLPGELVLVSKCDED